MIKSNANPNRSAIRTYATRRGARILQHGTVLSEVLNQPGPTHSVADVLAAALHVVSSGPKVALLGFSGGGLIAPLRAMGGNHHITALDLDDHGFKTFESLCRPWAGSVELHHTEACRWLQNTNQTFDHIMVDLSVDHEGEVETPTPVWEEIPPLVAARLNPHGTVIYNLLRPLHFPWDEGLSRISRPFDAAKMITFQEYQNRMVLAGNVSRSARSISRELTSCLRRIGSQQAGRISVRQIGSVTRLNSVTVE